jgi:hypothetical protein
MRFPFNNFTYCLTLFSKCFSSFDHSTCSLSVSGQYLALDGIYHPLGAAFPNNSTRRRGLTRSAPPAGYGTLTLCGILFQGTWAGTPSEAPSANYNSEAQRTPDFKFELLPLHSPLLGQSRLVSFPPLIDMLKFSGYPRLIRGQTCVCFVVFARSPSHPRLLDTRPPDPSERVTLVLLRSRSGLRRPYLPGAPPVLSDRSLAQHQAAAWTV